MTDILDAVRILLLIVFPLCGLITYLVIVNILTEKGNKSSNLKSHIFNLLNPINDRNKRKEILQKATNDIDHINSFVRWDRSFFYL